MAFQRRDKVCRFLPVEREEQAAIQAELRHLAHSAASAGTPAVMYRSDRELARATAVATRVAIKAAVVEQLSVSSYKRTNPSESTMCKASYVAISGMRLVTSPSERDGSADRAQPGRPACGGGVSGAGRPSRECARRVGPNRDRTAGRTFKSTIHGSAEAQ